MSKYKVDMTDRDDIIFAACQPPPSPKKIIRGTRRLVLDFHTGKIRIGWIRGEEKYAKTCLRMPRVKDTPREALANRLVAECEYPMDDEGFFFLSPRSARLMLIKIRAAFKAAGFHKP